MLRIPSGSKRARRSDLMITPNEAKTPKALGWLDLRAATSVRSARVRAWKSKLTWGLRTARAASASGPLPKKISSGVVE